MADRTLEKGLPANLDAERLVLGAILTDESAFVAVAAGLSVEDFSLEKHRRIFARMMDLNNRGERIDRITLIDELMKQGQLESVDGMSYIISLDDGLPQIFNPEAYANIIREKALLRRIVFAGQEMMDRAMLNQEGSADILESVEERLLNLRKDGGPGGFQSVRDILDGFEGGISAFFDPAKRQAGLSTGYVKLDQMSNGMHPGDLIILGARPAMGKTALALNIAQRAVSLPAFSVPTAIFSLEMSKESLLTRMACAAARVDMQKYRAGYLNKDERRRLMGAASDLQSAPLYIDDAAGLTIMELHAKLRKLAVQVGQLGLVVVDYLQLMSGPAKSENRVTEVSYLSRGLKLMAKELGVPMLVLSQLSRAPEKRADPIPQLADLRETGAIEQDADMVWFLFREEYYKPDREDLRGLADLIVAKQRNGPVGRVKLAFLREFTKFENLAADLGEEFAPASTGGEEI